jgi:hypothetical protein
VKSRHGDNAERRRDADTYDFLQHNQSPLSRITCNERCPRLNLLARMTFYGFLPERNMGGIPEFELAAR